MLLFITKRSSIMFGSRKSKEQRLELEVQVIKQKGNVRPGRLARVLGKSRGLIERDLADLEERGIKLCEDAHGRLSLFERGEDK
jgi:DeoR/GlpR family transcriptional regulator of sugar metabolism